MIDVVKGVEKAPFRILLHGTEGIGKSTFAACAPCPIFVATEDRIKRIDTAKYPVCKTMQAFRETLAKLKDSNEEYETLVIDSLDWFEVLATQEILAANAGYDTLADFPFGKGYAKLLPIANELMEALEHFYAIGMNVILIAHSKSEKVEDPLGASYDQWSPRLDKRINPIFKEWVDCILFATHKVVKKTLDEGHEKKRTIASEVKTKDGNSRVIYTVGTPAIVAKNSYDLPAEMSLDGIQFFDMLDEVIYGRGE